MIQDSKGYMWFATENGVARFDGYEFVNYSIHDGLPANSTLKLYEDYCRRIWFLSYQGPISYYNQGKIFTNELDDSVGAIGNNLPFFDKILVDSSDNIYLSGFYGGIYRINRNNKFEILEKQAKLGILTYYYLFFNEYPWGSLVSTAVPPDTNDMSDIQKKSGASYFRFHNSKYRPSYQKYCFKINEKEHLISSGCFLKHIDNERIICDKGFQNNVIGITKDFQNNIWINVEYDCTNMYPDGDLLAEPKKFLVNNSVSKVLQDYDGNYWFSTTENGVYLVPDVQFTVYNKMSLNIDYEIVTGLKFFQNNLFFSTGNKGFYSFKFVDDTLVRNPEFKLEGIIKTNINEFDISEDGILWVVGSEFLKYDQSGTKMKFLSNRKHDGYGIFLSERGLIYLCHSKGFYIYDRNKYLGVSYSSGYNKKTFTLCELNDSSLLVGSMEGLYKFNKSTYSKFQESDTVLNSRISEIVKFQSSILVGTFDLGMAIVNEDTILHLNKESGLSSNRIKVIYVDNDSTVWVGTNNGVNQITFNDSQGLDVKIIKYSIWDGLPSKEINAITRHNELIWLGTDKGLVSFDPGKITKPKVKPKLNIEYIFINENDTIDPKNSPILNYNENNLDFHYKAIGYNNPGNIMYLYKLEGLESEWIETKNVSVRYPNLKSGEYKFVVKAQNYSGIWSEPSEFSFSVRKHFSETYIFQFFLYFVGIGLILLIAGIILKTQKNRSTLKQEIVLAEQKAIRSQMNPHFLYNSLNSIQHLIFSHDESKANIYLSSLSTLMRRILETSKSISIPLRDELENLELYLSLEKLRFEEHFNYFVNIDKSIKISDIEIPSMIVQPYIENAIWHGLVPKSGKGNLKIIFVQPETNWLMITIEDDGIGRKKAGEISNRRKNYKSLGMKNTAERIKLINKLLKTNMSVNIIDLYYDNNRPAGTKVELLFEV